MLPWTVEVHLRHVTLAPGGKLVVVEPDGSLRVIPLKVPQKYRDKAISFTSVDDPTRTQWENLVHGAETQLPK